MTLETLNCALCLWLAKRTGKTLYHVEAADAEREFEFAPWTQTVVHFVSYQEHNVCMDFVANIIRMIEYSNGTIQASHLQERGVWNGTILVHSQVEKGETTKIHEVYPNAPLAMPIVSEDESASYRP